MIVPVYQSEISTKEIRGRLVSLQQLAITIGIAVSFWTNYGNIICGNYLCIALKSTKYSHVYLNNRRKRNARFYSSIIV